ncbi:UNVERIFIED_CONTAM: hypothetical protein Slati_3827300 [Sesamum latifolium]|uniref:CCHC-type domain-containing protein n=1 Tax=Sesamum latifolium TaxID=2727402 RepID=A0AAW2TKD6_9LAMI
MNAQMTALTHKMDNLGAAIWNGAPMGPCDACGQMGHLSQDCQVGNPNIINEDANFVSHGGRSNFNPYSNTYNPGWRSHPNFSWSNNQQQGPTRPHQPRQPPPQEPKSNLEDIFSNSSQQQTPDFNIKMPRSKIWTYNRIPSSAKFLKEVLSNKKKWEEGETVKLNEECSAILQNKLPPKLKDPGSFSIPCTIGNIAFDKVLCDLGASVNLMPYSIFEKLGMHEFTPFIITLQLEDRSIKYPRGIVEDVLVKVRKFILPVDFIVLDMEEDKNMPLILGRPFLATSRALIDVQKGQLTFRVNDEHVVFNVFKPMKYLHKKEHAIFSIDSINTFGTDNVHLVKCEEPKEDCIENSNGDNLQKMKEEHEEVLIFVDTRQEVKSKL